MIQTEARNATLADLNDLLKRQHDAKVDVVAPATTLRSKGGVIHVKDADVQMTMDGVTIVDGAYVPTAVFDGCLADALGIPVKYVRRMRDERPDLYDANVNGWLHGKSLRRADWSVDVIAPADTRSFLFRAFRDADGGPGIARSLHSSKYRIIDNLDVLTAALGGIKDAGVNVEIQTCDLTERSMHVRVVCPEIKGYAPTLLQGYRSPFDNGVARAGGLTMAEGRNLAEREGLAYDKGTEPVVFAGFSLRNSETGDARFSITPVLTIQVCRNGLVITKDVLAATHLGARMDDGIVQWSDETRAKAVELVTLQTRDAVTTFLDVDYVTRTLAEIDAKADAKVTAPAATVTRISKALKFDEATTAGILDHFIRGGQMTAGGVVNAVTSHAQTVSDADAAWDIERAALRALDLVTV